jgi:heme-degrading monooxygenase HmoA
VQLAQVNVGRLRAPEGSAVVAEFYAALESINALAERSPGFVWRHMAEAGEGHTTPTGDDELMVINLSVWETYVDLHAFVYRSAHNAFLRRRLEWFEPMAGPIAALWWVEDGTEPTVEHALARLERLREHGPSPQAFSLLRQYDADGRPVSRRS